MTLANMNTVSAENKVTHGLLSHRQAAEYLGMSEGWLYGSGIPFVKLGRRRLYRLEDLKRFVELNISHRKYEAEA